MEKNTNTKPEFMKDKHTLPLQQRTDAKLCYANVHLDELKKSCPLNGTDFDKAHQESFLFHLFGARDAFLAELNHYYQAGLSPDELSLGKIREALQAQNRKSSELSKIYKLEKEKDSWYSLSKNMRDHSMHFQGVKRAYFVGDKNDDMVKLKHPRTGELTEDHFIIEFENWHNEMKSLILSLRDSALSNVLSGKYT